MCFCSKRIQRGRGEKFFFLIFRNSLFIMQANNEFFNAPVGVLSLEVFFF